MRKRLYILIPLLLIYHVGINAQMTPSSSSTQTTTVISTPTAAPTNTNQTVITTTTSPSDVPTAEDEKIVTAVYDKFANVTALIGTTLTVSSLNGIVTINGTVTSQSQADAAVEAARTIPGVKDARSNINVTTNPDINKPAPSRLNY